MKTPLIFTLILSLTCVDAFAQKLDSKSENRHFVGANLMPVLEDLFIPGSLGAQISYAYQTGVQTRLYTSCYFMHRSEDVMDITQMQLDRLNTFIIKAGIQHQFNPNNRKYVQTLFGYCIGFARYNISGNFLFSDALNYYGYIPYQQSFRIGFAELQYGKIFRLNSNLHLSAYAIGGVKSFPADYPVVDRIPGMGIGQKEAYLNFQLELWYHLKSKK